MNSLNPLFVVCRTPPRRHFLARRDFLNNSTRSHSSVGFVEKTNAVIRVGPKPDSSSITVHHASFGAPVANLANFGLMIDVMKMPRISSNSK